MFRCFIGRGEMSTSDLQDAIDDWVGSNSPWEGDNYDHTLKQRITDTDGRDTYYRVNVRFLKDNGKDNLLQKFTDKLENKVDWYRVGYHDCIGHDSNKTHNCSWEDWQDWTDKDVTIPSGVPTFP